MSTDKAQKHLKYGFTENTIIDGWAKNYPSIMNYLAKLNSRKGNVAMSLYHFCIWANVTPTQLLELKKDRNNLDAERLLDNLTSAKVNFPEKRKWHVAMCIRGFYRTNYCQLQAEAGRAIAYNPSESHALPSKEKRLALFKACQNPRDQALVMVGTTSALALESLAKLRWYHFEENWQKQDCPHISLPSDLLKGHGKGKYRGVRQETFITPEARDVLLFYRSWMTKNFNHQWTEDNYVFLSIKRNIGEPLTQRMISKKATILQFRAGVDFTFHDGRRIAQTALENAGCPNNWIKKIKGRKCSGEEAPYSKPAIEQLRAKYREALADLEFLNVENTNFTRKISNDYETLKKEYDVLIQNGSKKDKKLEDLTERMMKLENVSKPTLEVLLKRLEELEKQVKNS